MHQLAIDVGTTQIKFDLFKNNKLTKSKKITIDTYYDIGGKVYQKPNEIIEKVKEGICLFTKEEDIIDDILFSTAMHSIMPVFENEEPEEMFIWLDQRASKWVKKIKENKEISQMFYQKTGTPIHEMSPFSKIGSFNKDSWFSTVSKWLGMKEWLMLYFTHQEVLDYSMASATGLFNSETKKWDDEILQFVGIHSGQLAKLVDTNWWTEIAESVSTELSLSPKTKIYVGASDGCLASLASYVANGTANTLTIGTSGAVRKLSRTRQLDTSGQSFCYYLTKDYWVIGGATNNGGKVLEWASDIFYENDSIFNHLEQVLETSTIGSKGILFLPYISGERAPLWTSDVTGEFLGLRLGHQKEDMVRSVIEGILFNAKWIAKIISLDHKSISLSGGFFDNPLMVELTADILGRKCFISAYSEPSYGLISLTNSTTFLRNTEAQTIFFNTDNTELYEEYFLKFVSKAKANDR